MVWGSGKPLQEFLHGDDHSAACKHVLSLEWAAITAILPRANLPLFNVGYSSDLSISALVTLINHTVGYKGKIIQDMSKPDGTLRKLMDNTKIKNLGWSPRVPIWQGIAKKYDDFLAST